MLVFCTFSKSVIKYFHRLAYADLFVLNAIVLLALAIDTLNTAATDGIVYLCVIDRDEAYLSARSLVRVCNKNPMLHRAETVVPMFVILTGLSSAITRRAASTSPANTGTCKQPLLMGKADPPLGLVNVTDVSDSLDYQSAKLEWSA
ncbi:hypothetical protein C8R44DRAFT_866388 [Mycena epipterygia]|nr:hypothetical protein C8R44DRAFT_866388 [Mycena epipterygia]